jgi:hypothetical protein
MITCLTPLEVLYGLKQAKCLWFLTITEILKLHGFSGLPFDPCVLRNNKGDLLVLWVNKIATVSSIAAGVHSIKALLMSQYEIKDLGETSKYLGLNITRDRGNRKLYVSQHLYIAKILRRCHMADALPAQSPAHTTKTFVSKHQLSVKESDPTFSSYARVSYVSSCVDQAQHCREMQQTWVLC